MSKWGAVLKPIEKKPLAKLGKPGGGLKPLPQFSLKAPDPLKGSKPTGDLEADTNRELGQIEQGFRERMKVEAERFKAATDTNYYFCAVFETAGQCDAFLAATGLDKGLSDLFIDGRQLAALMDIELPKNDLINFRRKFKKDPKLRGLT